MDSRATYSLQQSRRSFLGRASLGIGGLAAASLLRPNLLRGTEAARGSATLGGLPELPHFAAKAKRVIFLCMAGGPSQLETFDHKPELAKLDGKPMPDSFTRGQPIAQLQGAQLKCLGPQFKFRKVGANGQEISDLLPHIQSIADKICIVRSLHTDQINHDPAHTVVDGGRKWRRWAAEYGGARSRPGQAIGLTRRNVAEFVEDQQV